jgi:hypothetical protein
MLKPVASTNPRRLAILLLAALPALADTHFRVRRMKPTDAPLDRGQCDIRLQVDGDVEVSMRGDMVSVHTISGRDARNEGSECNQPLPDREVRGFSLESKESHGEIHLVAPPSEANEFQAIVHINSVPPGGGGYHFRLTWQISAGSLSEEAQAGPPGFVWNNATRYKTRGQGEVSVGGTQLGLLEVDAAIDLGGKVWISFGTARKERLFFSGVVNGRDGGRVRADVVCNDPEWHVQGPMFLTVDEAHDRVTSITLDATDGHDRMHLDWKRRK